MLLGILLLRSLVVQSFLIPSGSMEDTLRSGDRIAVNRLAYRVGDVRRGDVVVFDGAGLFVPRTTGRPSPVAALARAASWLAGTPAGSTMYVKRVVGLPGERVVCCDRSGRLTVDGRALDEPYLHPGDAPSLQRFDVVVPPGRLWVMGDHRRASADSRAHLGDPGGGTVPLRRVVGRAEAVYWPLGRAAWLRESPTIRAEDPS